MDNKPSKLQKIGFRFNDCEKAVISVEEVMQMCSFYVVKMLHCPESAYGFDFFGIIETPSKLPNGKPVPLFIYLHQMTPYPEIDEYVDSLAELTILRSEHQIKVSKSRQFATKKWNSILYTSSACEFYEFKKTVIEIYFSS